MSFNQYQKLPDGVMEKLPFLGTPYYYVFKDSAGDTLRGILFAITRENYAKAKTRLVGNGGEIVSGDKVYVLPNCRIPLFKLKYYLSEIGASLTGEVAAATKIIGHAGCEQALEYGQALNSSMLINPSHVQFKSSFRAYQPYHGTDEEKEAAVKAQQIAFNDAINNYEDMFEEDLLCKDTIISRAVWNNINNFRGSHSGFFITPTTALVLYYHMLNSIPVINEDVVFEKIGKPIVIGEDEYKTVYDMLKSPDEESRRMGAELLSNCDIVPSLYYIWKIAVQFGGKVDSFSRFKNVRLFIRMSKWNQVRNMDAEEAIEYIYTKGILTKDQFTELFHKASQDYSDTLSSSVFEMKMYPSERFKEFRDDKHMVIFNKEAVEEEVEIVEEEEEDEDD